MASRNLAVDLFRGFALLIIFINHMPMNPLFFYTPSRFGFSDAAEILVFCSGIACAYAYHKSFMKEGIAIGTLRILKRTAQLYAVHVGMFLLLATLAVRANPWLPDWDLLSDFSLAYFFEHTYNALEELMMLTYVPNFFDILPLYMVLLLIVPCAVLIQRWLNSMAVLLASFALYCAAWHFGWELTADRLQARHWYFNPFCWQFLFVLGYAAGAGWLAIPAMTKTGARWSAALLILALPLSWPPLQWHNQYLQEARALLEPWLDKRHLGLLRILYFIVLANVARALWLQHQHVSSHPLFRALIEMGQQSLPVFVAGTLLSFAGGIVLYQTGLHPAAVALTNCLGALLLYWVAILSRTLKTLPHTAAANTVFAPLAATA